MITEADIGFALEKNRDVDLRNCFVTDGRYLYYMDGSYETEQVRETTIHEQYSNIFELAKALNKTKPQLLSWMREKNITEDSRNSTLPAAEAEKKRMNFGADRMGLLYSRSIKDTSRTASKSWWKRRRNWRR